MWKWIFFYGFKLLSSLQSRSRLGYDGKTNISSGHLAKALAVLGLSIQPARLHTSYEARTICRAQQERGEGKRRGRGQPAIFSMEGRQNRFYPKIPQIWTELTETRKSQSLKNSTCGSLAGCTITMSSFLDQDQDSDTISCVKPKSWLS